MHHHAVVAVLGLERSVEGRRHAPVHRRIARYSTQSVRPRERLGVFDARFHIEIELTHVHRDEKHPRIGALFVGANERHVNGQRGIGGRARNPSQPRDLGGTPFAFTLFGILPNGLHLRRRPVRFLDGGLRRIENRRRRVGRDCARETAARLERKTAVGVAQRERRVLERGDGPRANPGDRPECVDGPVREPFRQVHRRGCAHSGHRGSYLDARGVETTAPRRRGPRAAVGQGEAERVLLERELSCPRGRLERDVDSPHTRRGARLLKVRDGGHRAIDQSPGPVLGRLAAKVQGGQALLLTVGPRRERRATALNDEFVVVAERRIREVVCAEDLERRAFGRDSNAGSPYVPCFARGGAREKKDLPAQDKIGRGSAGGLPANVVRGHEHPTGPAAERACERWQVAGRGGSREAAPGAQRRAR